MPFFLSRLVSFNGENKESNHPLIVFQLAIIIKHKLDSYPSVALWVLCSLYKTLTKAKKKSCDPCFLYRAARTNEQGMDRLLICLPNWVIPSGKTKDGIYTIFCFSVVPFSALRIEETQIGIMDHISIFNFWLRNKKTKRKLNYPFLFSIMEWGNDGAFPFFNFSSCKGKHWK